MFRKTLVAAATSVVMLAACSSDDPGVAVGSGTDGGNPDGSEQNLRRLRVVDNSDEFYSALREALIRQAGTSGNDVLAVTDDVQATAGGAADSDGSSAESSDLASAPTATADSAGSSDSGNNEVTGTNVQEVGVDEADRIKTDGEHLFVLDTQYSNVSPLAEPGIAVDPIAAPTDVPEGGSTMPAPQQTLTDLRILSLAPDAPDASLVATVSIDLGGRNADGMYLYSNGDDQSVVLTSSGFPNYWAYWNSPYSFASLTSSITRVDVSDPAQASVSDHYQIDGQIISSRRIGKNLFVASRFYPQIPGFDPYALGPDEVRNTVEAADLEALLPQYTRNSDGQTQPLFDPAGCFVADAPRNDYYYSPDIITLAVIDLDTMQLSDSECYLGASETLYASPNAVYLATTQWDYSGVPEINFDDVAADIPYVDPRVDTDIHQFTISDGQLDYVGSGKVRGHLGWDELRKPFRMSEKDGYLRVATLSDRQASDVSPINVSVLQPDGQGSLKLISELPNENRPLHIGKPGEQLYASRFLGDKAYLVTFRQTDPLYVIDLSNPADPLVAGELEIAGYSDYLQPIDENYLLGIGKDAVPAPDLWGDGRGALAQGVKLSLFNVSNPAAPVEVQSIVIGQRGTEATALRNHRAITIQPATDQHPTRVAFGIDVAGLANPAGAPTGDQASIWYPWNYTGLHGFEVRTGADAGVTSTGVMVVESAAGGDFQYGPLGGDDRSVIFNDSVYYIHGPDVYAAPWSDMGNRVGPR